MRFKAVSVVLAVCLALSVMADMTPGVAVPAGQPFPIVADFNGDGLDDLIQERNVLLNSGGTLAAQRDFGLPVGERVVAALDVNGDQRLDLLTIGSMVHVPPSLPQPPMQSPGYRLYIADASRNYAEGIAISSGPRPYVADVDGNGKDDLVIFAEVWNEQHRSIGTDIYVLRSQGDGTFDVLPPFRISATSPQLETESRIQSGDLDHDGAIDLVIRMSSELLVLRGTGDGHFTARSRFLPVNHELLAHSIRLGDIDGDSNLDVILMGFRSVRVLFGDGRGNFPRTTRARIAKLHDASGLPAGVPIDPDQMNQPKNVVLGHFTRSDQLQIAAGTGEGDIVILGYEQGALREASRTSTELWLIELRAGSFDGSGNTDLYAVGTLIWGEMYPRPRVFVGADDGTSADTSARSGGRRRAVGTSSAIALRMQMQAECIDPTNERWSFQREGIFGVSQRGAMTIETVFDESRIDFRMTAPFASELVIGVLTQSNGVWSGSTDVLTSCGWKTMTVNATIE